MTIYGGELALRVLGGVDFRGSDCIESVRGVDFRGY
jgi:hypothetical protein